MLPRGPGILAQSLDGSTAHRDLKRVKDSRTPEKLRLGAAQ